MKKKIYYNPSVVITTDCRINNAKCTCPAGGSPAFCKHVFAVLYAIEDYSCKEMYSTSTERLQTWHQPKPCKTLPLSSNQTFGKSHNETKKIKIDEEFKCECLDNFNLPCTLALANRDEVKLNLIIGLPAAVCSKKVPINMPQLLLDEIVCFHKHYCNDISELLNIERQTTGQNCSCSVWRNHRKIRLTASDVKQIVARKSDFPALASNIYVNKNKDLTAIRAVAYGIENENYVRNWFAQKYSQYVVRKTGLVIHPIYQFIA
ncbi:SWIM-type domain-containing protein [Trichonephila clavipes]|nr:SWIM-type domain-containing protein [Trichonephila clavipes]